MQENLSGNIINIATGKSINLLELITVLENETDLEKAGLNFEPAREEDILNSFANCQKYRKLINT